MRRLAEFVMRGRAEATFVCVIAAALPLLHFFATAIVALTLLRRGVAEGAMLLLWTSLPLFAWFMVNQDSSPLLVLFGTFGLAAVLRATVSWEFALVAAILAAAASSFVFAVVAPDVVAMFVTWYQEVVKGMGSEITEEAARQALLGFFAVGQAFTMILALILARWWQSVLYNPGGFRTEFHGMRISPKLSAALVVVIAALVFTGGPLATRWVLLLTVPLVFPAIALVHWLIARKNLTTGWLVTFYLAFFLMIQFMYPILTSLGLVDSWMNVRQRLDPNKPETRG